MGQLEMKFEDGVRNLQIKMDGIEASYQFKILELCMHGVKEEPKQQPEELIVPEQKMDLKEGYQLFDKPLLETKEEPPIKINTQTIIEKVEPRINTYNIKERSIRRVNGVDLYQLFYICPDCGNKGKHYIKPGTPKIQCHEYKCGKWMMVRLGTPKGLPEHDAWGNYYIAGEFKMSLKDKEDEEKFHEEEENKPLISNMDEEEESDLLVTH